MALQMEDQVLYFGGSLLCCYGDRTPTDITSNLTAVFFFFYIVMMFVLLELFLFHLKSNKSLSAQSMHYFEMYKCICKLLTERLFQNKYLTIVKITKAIVLLSIGYAIVSRNI